MSPPFPKNLRFNPATVLGSGADRKTMPAMIAAVESAFGTVAVQRTFLDPRNVLQKPVPKPKVSLSLLGTAAIRLAPATDEQGLAEGIEDALPAMRGSARRPGRWAVSNVLLSSPFRRRCGG